MFYDLREKIISFVTSRFLVPFLMLAVIFFVLIARIFKLQIVNGDSYRANFTLSIEKQVNIPSTRGNIYDRNGELLAYNKLAYSVTITDTIESGSTKNRELNEIVLKTVDIIEGNGDSVITNATDRKSLISIPTSRTA